MTNKFTHISLKPDTKQRLKDLMAKYPKYYRTYDKVLRFMIAIAEDFRPEILLTIIKNPVIQGEMSEEDWDDRRKREKIIGEELDRREKEAMEKLEG